jgi:hypothetical protein
MIPILSLAGENHFFVNMEIRLTFQLAGKIAINHDINAVNVEPYRRPTDYVRACLELIVGCAIFFSAYKEIAEAVSIWHKRGTFWPYLTQVWNYIDIVSLALLITAVIMR